MTARIRPWDAIYPAPGGWDVPLARSTLPELLDRAVAAHGGRDAISFDGEAITYTELGARVARGTTWLAGAGVRANEVVGLLAGNTPAQPLALFALLGAGAVVAQLSPLDPPRAMARKLADVGARRLVTTDAFRAVAEALAAEGAIDRVVVIGPEGAMHDQVLIAPSKGAACTAQTPAAAGPEADPALTVGAVRTGAVAPLPIVAFRDMTACAAAGNAASPCPAGGDSPGNVPRPTPGTPTGSTVAIAAVAPASLPRDVDDVAILQFTGGTTGVAKAAMLTHGNLTAAVSAYDLFNAAPHRRIHPGDRVMAVLPLFHIYALTAVLLRTLHAGATLLLRPRFDPATALDDIEAGCTHFYGVPTMWIAIVNHPGAAQRDWSRLRIASSGGASLPPEISQRMHAMTGLTLGGGWGMTETAPAGTNLLPDCPHAPGLIGVPLPGVDVQVVALDDSRRVLPPGQAGELRIRGPNVMPGYWNRPADNATAFVDGWFLTGDIGTMAPDGQFTLVDRKKEMLISGGFNVYPRVIEDAIHEHPDVHEAAVIGVPDPYRGQAAKAFVSLRAGAAPLTLAALRAFLAPRLGRHELPAQLEVRDALPHTAVGKLAKLQLHEGHAP